MTYIEEEFELSESIEELAKQPVEEDNNIRARINYGPIKKGAVLVIVETGPDWYGVKNCGRKLYVPKHVVGV